MNAQQKINAVELNMVCGGKSTVVGRTLKVAGDQLAQFGEWGNRNVWGMSKDKCKQIRRQADKMIDDNVKIIDKNVNDLYDKVVDVFKFVTKK